MKKILTVLVVLIITITLLLDNSIAIEKSKDKKEKTKTSQQKQTPMEKKPIEKYDLNPVDLTAAMLPKNYMGNDLKSIYEALKKRKENAQKGEYETTDQYKQRIQDEEHKPLTGTLTVNDLFSFVVIPESEYSADSQTLILKAGTTSVIMDKESDISSIGIHVPVLIYKESTYIGSNAYGASTGVEKIRWNGIVLALSNKSALPLATQEYGEEFIKLDLENITPETAKAIRENLCIAFICKLEPQAFISIIDKLIRHEHEPRLSYLSQGFVSHEPNRDYPRDFLFASENVHALSKGIWVFNKTNGEILLKTKTDD